MDNYFSEFDHTSSADWKNQLFKELKDETFDSLIWNNENGFNIHPFYTSNDLNQIYHPAFTHSDWEICVNGKANTSQELNTELLKNLNRGATSISVNCLDHNLDVVLSNIQLNFIHSTFIVNNINFLTLKKYLDKNFNLNELNISIFYNQISSKQDLETWHQMASVFNKNIGIKTICIDALHFHNKNCSAYYEIAIILSSLIEHLEFLNSNSDVYNSKIVIKTGVNSDYFVQISKLRALRRLWPIISKVYNVRTDIHLITETSLTNISISDNYNNILRTSIDSMAAVIGGCNELIVNEFDILSNNDFSERLAINQQLIIKEESYFHKMADVSCGSFYIESLTDLIAKESLKKLKYFESEGGYFKCLEKSIFSEEIIKQSNIKNELLFSKKHISVGVNQFFNENEKKHLSQDLKNSFKASAINNPVLNYDLNTNL